MNRFDMIANSMLRNNLILCLSLALKRMPTDEEIFEEFMCLMDGKIKTDLELRAEAFPLSPHEEIGPTREDMIANGYWERPDDE